jgi:catechol 2,3-dioxygenase-like lactoylglutathione lyase family enzyme
MADNSGATTVQVLKAHLAINVKNVNESIAFYRKLWGIEPSKVRSGYAKFDVENPPLNFTLNEGACSVKGALSHLGIQVASTEDVMAMRARWIADGLLPRDEMQTSCCYALQDKAWVSDPDGNEWEVFVVLEDNLAETVTCECSDLTTAANGIGGNVNANKREAQAGLSCCAQAPVGIAR